MRLSLGREIKITLNDCDSDITNSLSAVRELVRLICNKLQVKIQSETYHKFDPQGVSVVAILTESHCGVHTWPERGRQAATIDVFTCGTIDPVSIVPLAVNFFRAGSSRFVVAERDIESSQGTRCYPGYPEYVLRDTPNGSFASPSYRRGAGRRYFMEPEGLSWFQYFTSNEYVPPSGKDILLLHPCTWAKPYDFSAFVTQLRKITDRHERVHRVVVSNVGLVPFEYQLNEYFCSYDYIDISDTTTVEERRRVQDECRAVTAERIRQYIEAKRSCYRAVVLLGHPIETGQHSVVSTTCRQLGIVGFQVPSAPVYAKALHAASDSRDPDTPLFSSESLDELATRLCALETALENGDGGQHHG